MDNKKVSIINKIYSFTQKNKLVGEFASLILSLLVFFSGVILIVSATIPGVIDRMKFASEIFSTPIMHISNRLSLLIGFMLLIIFFDIKHKVKRSFYWTAILLIVGAVFTFMKGFDFEEAIALFIVFIILLFSKNSFYRESYPINKTMILVFFLISILSVFFSSVVGSHLSIEFLKRNNSYTNLVIHPKTLISSSIVSFIMAWGIIGFYVATNRKLNLSSTIDESMEQRLEDFLTKYEGNIFTQLLYLRDKNIYWSKNGRALVGYTYIDNVIVALGDLIGDPETIPTIIDEFQSYFDNYGYETSFVNVNNKNLDMYHDKGYNFFKVGEEAIVDLSKFDMSSPDKAYFRNIIRKFNKTGFEFKVLEPPYDVEFLNRLEEISDKWLNGRKEKGISMGFFDRHYLSKTSIGIVHNQNGDIEAFISLINCYDKKNMAVDLMRHNKEAPSGCMDFIFASILEWAKENNYKYFSLSISPLVGVGNSKFSHGYEKIAELMYKHGTKFYNFEGLRKFKNKFNPQWEQRYLVYRKRVSLMKIILKLNGFDNNNRKIKKLNK